MSGPLAGLRVLELLGLGPGPFCAMLLADLGADVIRIERPPAVPPPARTVPHDVLGRGRRSLALDLKAPGADEIMLDLVASADVLIEGFRPGVTERLGIGPEPCLRRNPRLVYGRMTGWGQHGPYRDAAGHDINYIAVAGALGQFGPAGGDPVAPLNLVGDFGGGGMLLAVGVLAAVLHARATGRGQVVDAAIVDGTATQMALIHGLLAAGRWRDQRGVNFLDGSAPFYTTYRCADGEYLAVGALEEKFYAEFLRVLGLADDPIATLDRADARHWPALRSRLAEVVASRTRGEWMNLFRGVDACVSEVLSLGEATVDEHLRARDTFVTIDGVAQPAPAPRFSQSGAEVPTPAVAPGRHSREVLAEAGLSPDRVEELIRAGTVAQS